MTWLLARSLSRIAGFGAILGFPVWSIHEVRHAVVRWALMRLLPVQVLMHRAAAGPSPNDRAMDPERVWIFWWQGMDAAPPLVQACVDSVRANFPEREVVILDKFNVREFAFLPESRFSEVASGSLSVTHFSDIVRMNVLSSWGGLWVDATVLAVASAPVPKGKFGFVSRRGPHCASNVNVARQRWATYFIGGPADWELWRFVENGLNCYFDRFDLLIDYHLFDYLLDLAYYLNIGRFREAVDSLPPTNAGIHDLTRSGPSGRVRSRETSLYKLSWKDEPWASMTAIDVERFRFVVGIGVDGQLPPNQSQ
ncbi:hypothetical protein IBJ60_19020 [Nocardioides sp. zg-578]|nr:hypothetical protein [Nocardioides marmotae]